MILHRSPRRFILRAFALVSIAVAVLATYRLGSTRPGSDADSSSTVSAPQAIHPDSPGAAGMRVTVDVETGDLLEPPLPREADVPKNVDSELDNALSRSTDGLEQVFHPDGRVSVHLRGRFQSASVARIDPDGSLETTCVETIEEADAFLAGGESTDASRRWEVQ